MTITDNSFLYSLWYFSFSILGNYNYFFFAAHLLDVAVAIASLRTILQSVTHNGKQLLLTVMLLTIIVYLYTVIAFNFFRKFYVQEEDDNVDKKCHDMLTCFVFHIYKVCCLYCFWKTYSVTKLTKLSFYLRVSELVVVSVMKSSRQTAMNMKCIVLCSISPSSSSLSLFCWPSSRVNICYSKHVHNPRLSCLTIFILQQV